MMLKLISTAVALVAIVGFFFLLPGPAPAPEVVNSNFLIRDVRFYDGDKLIEKTDIMVKDNLINSIAENIENKLNVPEITGIGKTLIPGLIDSHTHVWGDALEQALNYGVTTELDMFTSPEFSHIYQQKRDNLTNTNAADLFSATILATAPKGHGTEYGIKIPVLSDISEVEQFIRDRITDGADYIKVVYNAKESKHQLFPSISYEILSALVKSAHLHNKLLVVHVDNQLSAKHAIELGADGIIHSFMDSVINDQLVALMSDKNAFIIPTLSVESSMAELGIMPGLFQNAMATVSKLNQAGVVILAGTDAPNPGTSHGASIHGELEFLVAAGLTPEQALHSATGAVQKVFPVGQRGMLQPGFVATMLLLDGNPFDDITTSKKIITIWKNGFAYERRLSKNQQLSGTEITAGVITEFNQSISKTQFGQGITATTDQMVGGKSVVTLALKKVIDDKNNENQYLQIEGEIKTGSAYPWSGFSFTPGNSYSQGANLSQLKRLVFDAKSNSSNRELSIMFFQEGSFQLSIQKVLLNNSWQTIGIDLTKFSNIDLQRVSNISFVSTVQSSKFEFMIDNLKFE